jgi:hypothetical protein
MTIITIEVPDDVAAQIDPATLPSLLREMFAKDRAASADEGEGMSQTPVYREIMNLLETSPTAEGIVAFKISAGAQERLDYLLDKNRAESLSRDERAELDTYRAMNHLIIKLKARAVGRQRRAVEPRQDGLQPAQRL